MSPRKIARRRFWKDLTRTRHMTAVSAVVLGTTFMPLLGVPDVHELRTFQSAIEGFSDARAEAFTPRRNDEVARERSASSVIDENNRADGGSHRGAYRQLTVERPEREPADGFDTAVIMPLPPVDEPQAVVLDDEATLPETPEIEEVKPELPADTEDDIMEPEDPASEDAENL